MASPASSSVDAFTALDEGQQRAALASMSPEAKTALLGALQAKQSSPPVGPQPDVAAAITQDVPRPALPKALAPPTFSERIGERIKENAYAIPEALDALSRKMKGQETPEDKAKSEYFENLVGKKDYQSGTIPGIATGVVKSAAVVPRMIYDTVKGWVQDPASAAGDIISGYAGHQMGSTGKAAETEAVPPKMKGSTAEPRLSPEQQAKFTADIDAANAEYAAKSHEYYQKQSKIFDEAKRQATEDQAEFQTKTAEAKKAHAEKLAKAQADFEAEVASEAKSKSEWQAKMDAAAESRRLAADVENQRQSMAAEQAQKISDVRTGAQQIYEDIGKQIDDQWTAVRTKVGEETPTPAKPIVDAITDAEKEYLRGSPAAVKQFKDILREVGMDDLVETEQGDLTVPPDKTLPWQTVRVHSSALGRAASTGNLPGNVYQAIKAVRAATENVLGDVAKSRGAGADYQAVKAADHAFRTDFENLGNVSLGEGQPISRLVRAPSDTFAADHILGKAGDILVKNLQKWDPTGQLAQAVERARILRSQIKSLPTVKVLKEPPPYTGTTPVAKEVPPPKLPEQPGIPEKEPAVPPQLKTVKKPKPTPAEAKAGPIARTVGRLAGKVAGGTVGHAAGHPLLGYGLGGELGQQMADRLAGGATEAVPPKLKGPGLMSKTARRATAGAPAAAAVVGLRTLRGEDPDSQAINDANEDIQKFIDSLPK